MMDRIMDPTKKLQPPKADYTYAIGKASDSSQRDSEIRRGLNMLESRINYLSDLAARINQTFSPVMASDTVMDKMKAKTATEEVTSSPLGRDILVINEKLNGIIGLFEAMEQDARL